MRHLDHKDYYVARAAASRDLARQAADSAIAAIHSELAVRYDALAVQLDRKNGNAPMLVQEV